MQKTTKKRVRATLLFLLNNQGDSPLILLALKKRGIGAGKWNGVGGKINPGETAQAAAIRECQEEVGLTPQNLIKMGEISFDLPSQDYNSQVELFLAQEWEGELVETEEMRPQWFLVAAIPYDQMWADDREWLPIVLAGQKIRAYYTLGENEEVVESNVVIID